MNDHFRSHRWHDPDASLDAGIEITEDGVALAFTNRYANALRFDHDAGRWFEWVGGRWVMDGKGKALNYCRDLARLASKQSGNSVLKSTRRAAFALGVERFTRADPAHAVTQEVWDADPFLLGCPGITIDLRDGTSRKPDPANGITKLTAVAPAETAECQLWLAFLEEATGGDAGMIRFLQQWCGYCLAGDTREHALVFIYGPGGNGKSVFLNTVAGILGDYAATAGMETFTASKNDRHTTELASLRGARLVTASETEVGRAWAEVWIKAMTGGDPITARFMHKDPFTFRPIFKLVLVGNHKPTLRNVDEAARRRFNIVPFDRKPAEPDRQLEAKLREEWPSILRWMLQGCADWRENGLVRPETVTEATAAYFSDQDVFGHWLEDECIIEIGNEHRWEQTGDLFQSWRRYAETAGEAPGSQNKFAENMTRRGFQKAYKKVVGKAQRVWLGLNISRPGFSS